MKNVEQSSRIAVMEMTYFSACELCREWVRLLQQPLEDQLAIVLSAAHGRILVSSWEVRVLGHHTNSTFEFWYHSCVPGLVLEARKALPMALEMRSIVSAKDKNYLLGGAEWPEPSPRILYQDWIYKADLEPALERLRHGLRLCYVSK